MDCTVPASTVPASTVPASTVPASTVPASTGAPGTVPDQQAPVRDEVPDIIPLALFIRAV
jgi:hypothetical protein